MTRKTLRFETTIDAPRERVWATMLQPPTYEAWTAAFAPDSTFDGSWDEGARIRFLDGRGNGMIATVERHVPAELVTLRHLGELRDGVEDFDSDAVRRWAPALETYRFTSLSDTRTRLQVEMDITSDFEAAMQEAWPRALDALKRLCEGPGGDA